MAVKPSRDSSAGGSSSASAGIGCLGQRIRLRDGNIGGRQAAGGYGTGWSLDGRQDGLAGLFDVQLRDFGLDLSLELVRSPLEFIERPSDLASYFGQLLGPKQDQGKKEEENHLWEAQVHISHDTAGLD